MAVKGREIGGIVAVHSSCQRWHLLVYCMSKIERGRGEERKGKGRQREMERKENREGKEDFD